jgi:hypothetical protein
MAFAAIKGKMQTIWLPVTPSTALVRNTFVTFASGKLVGATSATASVDIAGILDKTIATTDSDYATDRLVPVLVPIEKHVVYEADVTSGLVAGDIGTEVDLTNSGTVNRAASVIKAVKVVKVLSSTKGQFLVKINGSY